LLDIAESQHLARMKMDGRVILIKKKTEFYYEPVCERVGSKDKKRDMTSALNYIKNMNDDVSPQSPELSRLCKNSTVFNGVINLMNKSDDREFPFIEHSPMTLACGDQESELGPHINFKNLSEIRNPDFRWLTRQKSLADSSRLSAPYRK
jgi:hypothetical protein